MDDGSKSKLKIQEIFFWNQPERGREQAKWTLKHCWIRYMLHGCWTEDQRPLPKVCTCKLINSIWKLSNRNCLSSQGNWRSSFPSFGIILRRAERFDASMTRTPSFFVVRDFRHTGSLAIQLNCNSDPCLFRVRLKTGGQKENSSKMARLSINCSKLLLLENRLCSWTVVFFLVWVTLSTFLVFLL